MIEALSSDRNMVYLAEISVWSGSVLWQKVYRSKIADGDELKTRLIDEWAQFDYRSLLASSVVV